MWQLFVSNIIFDKSMFYTPKETPCLEPSLKFSYRITISKFRIKISKYRKESQNNFIEYKVNLTIMNKNLNIFVFSQVINASFWEKNNNYL